MATSCRVQTNIVLNSLLKVKSKSQNCALSIISSVQESKRILFYFVPCLKTWIGSNEDFLNETEAKSSIYISLDT